MTEMRNEHIGERSVSSCGQMMEIINWHNSTNIDVLFPDGTIVKNRYYKYFLTGQIENPNYKTLKEMSLPEITLRYFFSQVGFGKVEKGELEELGRMELDFYNDDVNGFKLAGEYDGSKWHKNSKRDINKNNICAAAGIFLFRIREPGLPDVSDDNTKLYQIGRKPSIDELFAVAHQIINDINDKFGTTFSIVRNKDDEEKINKIVAAYYNRLRETRVGEQRTMNNGMEAVLTAYRSYNDVEVQFIATGDTKKTNYSAFKNGRVSLPGVNTEKLNNGNARIGQKAKAKNGQMMEIIEYFSAINITVKFDDGTVVRDKAYSSFLSGDIKNPNINMGNEPKIVSFTDINGNISVFPSITACAKGLKTSPKMVRQYLQRGYCKKGILTYVT